MVRSPAIAPVAHPESGAEVPPGTDTEITRATDLESGPGTTVPSSAVMAHRQRVRQIDFLIFAMVLFSGAWFYNGANWNHISRYDSVFSFVEPGTRDFLTFHIDHFVPKPTSGENTGDWSANPAYDNHLYSNKAPGPALMAIPLYALMYLGERAVGIVPENAYPTLVNCYLLNLAVTVLPLALAMVAFVRYLRRLSPGFGGLAAGATLALFFGTLLFPYSTQLWGHGTAAAFVIGAFVLADRQRLSARAAVGAGAMAGMAVLSEYSCAVTVLVIGLLLILRGQWRRLVPYGLGGLGPFIIHCYYHAMCFGNPFTAANLHNNPAFKEPGMAGGIFAGFQLDVMKDLTISPYRGLFWHMPILLVVGLGLLVFMRRRHRALAIVAWLHIALFLTWNIGFNGWHGGACIGPRYQIPTLPCYLLLGYLGLTQLHLRQRAAGIRGSLVPRLRLGVIVCLVVVSVANMSLVTAISPMGDERGSNPLRAYYTFAAHNEWTWLVLPPIRLDRPSVARQHAKFNLGEMVGLRRAASFVPWAVTCLLLLGAMARILASDRAARRRLGGTGTEDATGS